MIKIVSTYLAADTGAGDARRAEVCVTAKRRFGSYPLLDNASCLSSAVIGGREWAQGARAHRTCRNVCQRVLTVQ
jgi:hypothetical protein